MDIREKIYAFIQEKVEVDCLERTELAEQLVDVDRELLVQDLKHFYQKWLETQEEKDYTEERGKRERVQETCFEVVCEALALPGDPSVIPYLIHYVSSDKYKEYEVMMEDYNDQHLRDCISNTDYYGDDYIPVLLAQIHELVPEKMKEAWHFFRNMITQDDGYPFFSHLNLPKKEPFLQLIDYCMECAWDELKRDRPDKIENLRIQSNQIIESLDWDDEWVVQLSYVRQQFLKLHENDA